MSEVKTSVVALGAAFVLGLSACSFGVDSEIKRVADANTSGNGVAGPLAIRFSAFPIPKPNCRTDPGG